MGIWVYNVQGFHDALAIYNPQQPETFTTCRDATVEALKASKWYQDAEEYDDLWVAVEELTGVDQVDWFDEVLATIYDLADDERAWLGF